MNLLTAFYPSFESTVLLTETLVYKVADGLVIFNLAEITSKIIYIKWLMDW